MARHKEGRPVKAYENPDFLGSGEGRALRIMAEYLEPRSRFQHHRIDDTIVFMGSARAVPREQAEAELAEAEAGGGDLEKARGRLRMSAYYEAARDLAHRLTDWSKGLEDKDRRFVVCSGGGPGLMEATNRGASEAQGINVGLGISLPQEQHGNPYITRELDFHFHYFFMRKFWFAYPAKAMVFLPGGFGTMDELFEILTLVQTGKMRKRLPIVLLGTEYWDRVMNLEAMVEWGAIDRSDLELIHRTDSVDDAFDFLVRELTTHSMSSPGASL